MGFEVYSACFFHAEWHGEYSNQAVVPSMQAVFMGIYGEMIV